MDRIRIGFLCSFNAQKALIKEVARSMSDTVDVSVELGVMDEAVQPAKKLEEMGMEVLTTWDATAAIIEKHVSIPVISIQISDLDLIRALNQAKQFGKNIALLYSEPLGGIELLEELLHVRIRQIPFKTVNDFKYGLMNAFNDGCEVVIGKSYITLDVAKEYKKKAVLITFTNEMVVKSIRQLVKIAEIRRREREEFVRLQTIFNSLADGVVVIDSRGNTTLVNPAAEKMFNIQGSDVLGLPVSRFLPSSHIMETLSKKKRFDYDIIDFGDSSLIAGHEPVFCGERIIGVASTFRTVSEIQKIDHKIRDKAMSRGFTAQYGFQDFFGKSPAMKEVTQQAKIFAQTDSTILITGETGTGKEVMAQSIHNFSRRKNKPFVAINCTAIAENLLESELFGYEEGAFTGARKGGKIGLFELAHEGTIFLDEIGSMPVSLQSRLLRVLQERKVMRIGGERLIPIDVRIIAATNKDLLLQVKERLFREDLYYRLNVLSLNMPPLRERQLDLPDLIDSLTDRFSEKYKRKKVKIPKDVVKVLTSYPWPGNIRELENVTERLVLLFGSGKPIHQLVYSVLMMGGANGAKTGALTEEVPRRDYAPSSAKEEPAALDELKKKKITDVLEQANFNISKASSFLGISRSTLYRKMKRFGLLAQ
jgi:transcriptional regulator with PAS, ATPase and Fis domain